MIRTITFEVLGEPQGKGRPRFARRGAYVSTYTPPKTKAYEKMIRDAFIDAASKNVVKRYMFTGFVSVDIEAYFDVPKSVSKVKRDLLRAGGYCNKKPDGDNIIKVVLDALNEIAYADDKNVIDMHVTKYYAAELDNPCIIVRLTGDCDIVDVY